MIVKFDDDGVVNVTKEGAHADVCDGIVSFIEAKIGHSIVESPQEVMKAVLSLRRKSRFEMLQQVMRLLRVAWSIHACCARLPIILEILSILRSSL